MSRAAWKGTWGGLWARYTGKWFHIQIRVGRVRWKQDDKPEPTRWRR